MFQRKKLGLILLILVILGEVNSIKLKSKEVNDLEVQEELQDFIEQTESELNHGQIETQLQEQFNQGIEAGQDFESIWQNLLSVLDQRVNDFNLVRTQHYQECSELESEREKNLNQLEINEQEIQTLQTSIQEIDEKIEKIFDDKCQTHQNYLTFIKNSITTRRLLDFLQQAVESYSLIQIRSVGKILSQYKNSKLSSQSIMNAMLAELKNVDPQIEQVQSLQNKESRRSAEEVGTKQVDENREELKLDSFDSSERRVIDDYKVQILELIGNIRKGIEDEVQERQNGEIELNEKVIVWTTSMNIENEQNNKKVNELTLANQKLNSDITNFDYFDETCKAELQWLEDKIQGYEEYRVELSNQRDLYEQQYNQILKSQRRNVLRPNDVLEVNQVLWSENGQYYLILQQDDNLVLFKTQALFEQDSSKQLWSTKTSGKGNGNSRLVLQEDGNIVLYTEQNAVLWSAYTQGRENLPNYFVIQDDGNLVVYDSQLNPLWESQTYGN